MSNSIARDFRFFSLIKFAMPTILMMICMSLYTIVDGIFVSRLVGSNALSSINIVFPCINLMIAVGVMFSSGGNALISRELGEGKRREAAENFSLLLAVVTVLAAALAVLSNLFLEPLVRLMGSTDMLLEDCKTYLSIMMWFSPACVLQLMFQTFFVTAGRPGLGLCVTMLGGIANVVLDYLFMGPMGMGIAGAALATGIGQTIPSVAGLICFSVTKGTLKLVKPKLRRRVLLESCTNGSSEMVTNISTAVVTYLFNIVMLRLVGESGVAAITIVLYGQFLFGALCFGFSMGVSPVIAFNFGSKNQKMLRRLFRISMEFIVGSSVFITALALVCSPVIVGIFTPAGTETYELAKEGFFLFSINYLFAGVNIFASALFTALSNGPVSAMISFARTFACLVACILLLPMVLGVTGVWLAVPAAEGITIFLAGYFILSRNKRYQYLSR